MKVTPRVFISATSHDLRPVRLVVKDGLLAIGCLPVEQTNFPPDYRSVVKMLEDRIRGCDAVIHVVGRRYGSEPIFSEDQPETERRSFTQLEYEIAVRLRKKLFLFVCTPEFPYADQEADEERPELRGLQDRHREYILTREERTWTEIASVAEVGAKVRELELSLETLAKSIVFQRQVIASLIFAGVSVSLVLISLSVWTTLRTPKVTAEAIAEATQDPLAKFTDTQIKDYLSEFWKLPEEEKDYAMAIKLGQEGVKRHLPEALVSWGIWLYEGEVLPKNTESARDHFNRAFKLGNKTSALLLGNISPQPEGLAWHIRGADRGDERCMQLLIDKEISGRDLLLLEKEFPAEYDVLNQLLAERKVEASQFAPPEMVVQVFEGNISDYLVRRHESVWTVHGCLISPSDNMHFGGEISMLDGVPADLQWRWRQLRVSDQEQANGIVAKFGFSSGVVRNVRQRDWNRIGSGFWGSWVKANVTFEGQISHSSDAFRMSLVLQDDQSSGSTRLCRFNDHYLKIIDEEAAPSTATR